MKRSTAIFLLITIIITLAGCKTELKHASENPLAPAETSKNTIFNENSENTLEPSEDSKNEIGTKPSSIIETKDDASVAPTATIEPVAPVMPTETVVPTKQPVVAPPPPQNL